MKIVDQDPAADAWRPWEPPLWLIAAGLGLALLVGVVVSQQVADPRVVAPATPTPCVPTAVELHGGVSYVWTFCPP